MQADDKDKPVEAAEALPQGIHLEAAPFEPGYQPGSLPEITVPDLAEDAVGVSAEVLAEASIPTLTEQVVPVEVPPEAQEVAADEPQTPEVEVQEEEIAQEPEPQADTWHEQMQVRMTKLSGDIQTLNDRLDRLEQRSKNEA